MDTREINNDGIDEHSVKEGENAVRRIFHLFFVILRLWIFFMNSISV